MPPQSHTNTDSIINIDFICSGKSINHKELEPLSSIKDSIHDFDTPRLSIRKIKYLSMSNAIHNIMNDPHYIRAVLNITNSKISS